MAKKKDRQSANNKPASKDVDLYQPWISMRSGLIIMAIVSVLFAAFIAWIAIPEQGTLQGILTGVMFGAVLWAIFFINIVIQRLLRRNK